MYPPDFDFDRLKVRALIDFVKLATDEPLMHVFPGERRAKWTPDRSGYGGLLTLQDPEANDLEYLAKRYPEQPLMEFEVSVDFCPKPGMSHAGRQHLLRATHEAVAGRFRPEDTCRYGYGFRGSVNGRGCRPKPFNDRKPGHDHQLLYGVRGGFLQAKVYLKDTDHGHSLPAEQHRLRLELAFRRGALLDEGILCMPQLLGLDYRKRFARHFRMIERPALRLNARRPADAELERKMQEGWAKAGVGAFGLEQLPVEASKMTLAAIAYRARLQLPMDRIRLVRHKLAHTHIANALRQLERRLGNASDFGRKGED
jgi:hypothetical protein